YRHCMAFDEARGRTVLFGGTSGSALYDDTWEWDGVDWTMASPPAHPSARIYHAMAYDRQRARAVLVGGTDRTTMFADTWLWDATSWSLAAGNDLDPQPQGSNLWQPDLAYDGTRQQCVLARGHATWTWDNVHWRRAPLAVGGIDAAVPAYDHLHDQVIALGRERDAFAFDGERWRVTAVQSAPLPRSLYALLPDVDDRGVILFGGVDTRYQGVSATWQFENGSWTDMQPLQSPPPRTYCAMACDRARGRIVLFGGNSDFANLHPNTAQLDDLWEWDGRNWQQIAPTQRPAARERHVMTFDTARNEVLLFGGLGFYSTLLGDTWGWNGSTWSHHL